MAIYELNSDSIKEVRETSFANVRIQERGDLQRLIRDHVEVVCPDIMIVSEDCRWGPYGTTSPPLCRDGFNDDI